MDVPGIVEDALEGEEVAAHVDLGGDDQLFVTPTRTLIYRSEGLLSDESVEAYDHDAERLSVSEGRRKTSLSLTYAIDGTEEFALPSSRADDAVPAILAGVLNANGVLEAGESVLATFRFSELTLVVTSRRLVKHVGSAAWDEEFEEFHYGDVTGISEEAGSVATQIVLEVAGRAERIKTPNDRAPEVTQSLENALRAYHDLGEHEDLDAALAPDDEDGDEEAAADAGGGMSFENGVDPLDAGDTSERVDGLDVESSSGDESADSAGGEAADSTAGESAEAAGGSAENTGGDAESAAAGAESTAAGAESAAGTAGDPASAGDAAAAGQSPGSGADNSGGDGASASSTDAPGSGAETLSEVAAGNDVANADGASAGGNAASAGSNAASADDAGAGGQPAADDGDASPATGGVQADESDPFEKAGFQSATDATPDLEQEVEELREAVQTQNELLARHQETIEQLVEELRRGR